MLNSQNNEIQAHFLANQGMKIVEAVGYSVVDSGCSSKTCKISFGTEYTIGDKGATSGEEIDGLFQRSFTLDVAGLTDAYKATMLVEWEDSTGNHEIEVKRILSQ